MKCQAPCWKLVNHGGECLCCEHDEEEDLHKMSDEEKQQHGTRLARKNYAELSGDDETEMEEEEYMRRKQEQVLVQKEQQRLKLEKRLTERRKSTKGKTIHDDS